MPRPTDFYTHDQFELLSGTNHNDGTIRCKHCHQWGGTNRPLHRKKIHLTECPNYLAWRAAGNGQDIAPPNPYTKRNSSALDESDPYGSSPQQERGFGASFPPTSTRNRMPDLTQFFDEFWDDSATQKCMRSRCKHCGTQRAKNSTRQWEHLQQCNDFLNSTEGQQVVADGSLVAFDPAAADQASGSHPGGSNAQMTKPYTFNTGPNPNFPRPSQKAPKASKAANKATPPRASTVVTPSLAAYLLSKLQEPLSQATQQLFLSHAGRSMTTVQDVSSFMTQQYHISRAFPPFIGKLIGKLRLTAIGDPLGNTDWRVFDLLASTMNNAGRELEFLRTTCSKYHITAPAPAGPARHATRSLIHLMEAASAPAASLLEGMIVLWAIEHLHLVSWHHAERCRQEHPPAAMSAPTPTAYSLPTYYQSPYGQPPSFAMPQDHNAALRDALIPNWTSVGFGQFVDACKAIVDELANAQTTGNGANELTNSESVFGQVIWLWGMVWPEVKPPVEEPQEKSPSVNGENGQAAERNGGIGGSGGNESPIFIDGDGDGDDENADNDDDGDGLG